MELKDKIHALIEACNNEDDLHDAFVFLKGSSEKMIGGTSYQGSNSKLQKLRFNSLLMGKQLAIMKCKKEYGASLGSKMDTYCCQ